MASRVTFLNPVAERLLGKIAVEVTGLTISEVFHIVNEETRELVENPVSKVLRTGKVVSLANHTILIDSKGQETPIDDSGAPIFGPDGEIQGAVLVFRDISARRQHEMLREKWNRVFLHAGFGIALLDHKTNVILEANDAFAAMHGFAASELPGMPAAELLMVIGVEHQETDHAIDETIHRRRDGSLFPVRTDSTISRNSSGAVVYRAVVCEDVTDRQRTSDALKDSEARFRGLAMALPHLVWTSNEQGTIDYTNAMWESYLGEDWRTNARNPWPSILHPEDVAEYEGRWRTAVDTGQMFEFSCRLRRGKDGTHRWFLCRAVPVRTLDGKIMRWLGTCSDTDDQIRRSEELKEANSSLMRSNDDLEQFAFAASHDLQEPLRMISLYTQLLKEEYEDRLDSNGRLYVDYAVTGVKRVERLLQDLLSYSRMSGPLPAELAPVPVNRAINTALENLKAVVQATQAHIQIGEMPVLRMPETHLVQLFQNLISNAIKYRSTGVPDIRIEARRLERFWQFSVADNGIGIDPQYVKQVFRLFKRLHGAEYEGTGIGLAICQKIVERQGGRIWVESRLGSGSTFFFTLPQQG